MANVHAEGRMTRQPGRQGNDVQTPEPERPQIPPAAVPLAPPGDVPAQLQPFAATAYDARARAEGGMPAWRHWHKQCSMQNRRLIYALLV